MRHFTLAAITALSLVAATPLLAQTPAPATGTQQKMAPPPAAAPAGKMAPATTAAPAAKAAPAAAKQSDLIDINSATEAQLSTLPGVAKARSEAIIKGRPYKGKDELVSKKIIPENVYKDIKDKIIAHQKS